ncbi:MAG TPA: hypothetical protein VGJ78_06490 [Vicinamibacterales bacterium]
MDDSACMRRGQRTCHLGRDVDRLPHDDGAGVDPLAECLPFDELGHHEGPTVEIAEIVDDENVRMVE